MATIGNNITQTTVPKSRQEKKRNDPNDDANRPTSEAAPLFLESRRKDEFAKVRPCIDLVEGLLLLQASGNVLPDGDVGLVVADDVAAREEVAVEPPLLTRVLFAAVALPGAAHPSGGLPHVLREVAARPEVAGLVRVDLAVAGPLLDRPPGQEGEVGRRVGRVEPDAVRVLAIGALFNDDNVRLADCCGELRRERELAVLPSGQVCILRP